MKGKTILLLLAAGSLLLAGCQKSGILGTGGTDGGAIRFTASAAPGTKTVYGDYDDDDPTAATWQSIDWVNGDAIRIYSDAAVRRVDYELGKTGQNLYYWADYQVTEAKAGSANNRNGWSKATLINLSNDGQGQYYDQEQVGDAYHVGNGLMWPAGTQGAKFYAIYPAPTDNSGKLTVEGKGNELAGTQGTLAGSIPASQEMVLNATGAYVTDMSYAYMTAVGTSSQPATDNTTNIPLDFYPAFTAFEFSLKNDSGESIGVKSFTLTAGENDPALTGAFTATYSGTAEGTRTLSCTGTGKTVTFTFPSGTVIPASTATAPLSFTIFALPQDLTGLRLTFTILEGEGASAVEQTRSLDLTYRQQVTVGNQTYQKGDYVTFTACKKHRINGLVLPKNIFNFRYINLAGVPIEWSDQEVEANNADHPEATQFDVEGVNNGRYYTSASQEGDYVQNNKDFRQYWLLDANHSAIVRFKVMSPVGYDWLIVPQGDTDSFTITADAGTVDQQTGSIRGPILTTDEETGAAITTNIHLYISAKPNVSTLKKVYFKTYVISRGENAIQYSIDSETQLFDTRGYHYFILNWDNQPVN